MLNTLMTKFMNNKELILGGIVGQVLYHFFLQDDVNWLIQLRPSLGLKFVIILICFFIVGYLCGNLSDKE